MKTYKVVATEHRQLGRFELVLDTVEEAGKTYPYSYVSMKRSVGVLAFAGEELILIRQYRHALGTYEVEIPGGGVEEGEDPRETARRETEEETGHHVSSLCELGTYYPSPGATNEICTLYLAQCDEAGKRAAEPLEYLEVLRCSTTEFEKMIADGSFRHSMGLVAWLYYRGRNGDISC